MTSADLTPQETALIERIFNHMQAQGMRERPSQRSMAIEVARSLALGLPSLVEAPTGTGKSLAYLIGGGVIACTRDRRLIVSTAGTGLQDQLIKKDVPMAAAAFEAAGLTLPSAVLKGRGRYVCPERLEQLTSQSSLFEEGEQAQAIAAIRSAIKDGWSGCRDHLPYQPAFPVWTLVQNDRNLCDGKECAHYETCPYYRSVDAAISARVVITNHDYLLAFLGAAQSGVMCDFDRNIYVFDEGHHLNEHIISAFRSDIVVSPDDARGAAKAIAGLAPANKDAAEMAAERISGLCRAINQAALNIAHEGASQYRFPRGEVPGGFLRLLSQWRDALDALHGMLLPALSNASRSQRASTAGLAIKARIDVSHLEDGVKALDAVISQDGERAAWLEMAGTSWAVCVSPFRSADIARSRLWSKMHGVVITSATLSSLGTFDHPIRDLGLPDATRTLALPGVFDYARNARILVPKSFPDPTHPDFVPRLAETVRKSAIRSAHLGVLVYFTSRAMMENVYRRLTDNERSVILMQGRNGAVNAVVEAHRQRIGRGEKSIIFGLDGFTEGVDLPGNLCTRVLITKLPFQQLDDPVMKTHSEALEAAGQSSFALLALPRAGVKLAQICGRLLRTETDSGDILISDVRIVRKRYGAQLLRCVPIQHTVV
jgi:ATP-dependent DNA helicase DinG